MEVFFKNLFPPNDWIPIWADVAEWKIKTTYDVGMDTIQVYKCSYTIELSQHRNRYRLITRGKDPLLHHFYAIACAKMNELTRGLL